MVPPRVPSADGAAASAPVPHLEESAIDSVPDGVREAARRAFRARGHGADVLRLVTDSLVDEPPDAAGPRRLSFAGAGLPGQLRVTVLEQRDDPLVSFVVECEWEDAALDRVECDGEEAAVRPEARGRWGAGPVRHGLLRVGLQVEGRPLHTAWVRV